LTASPGRRAPETLVALFDDIAALADSPARDDGVRVGDIMAAIGARSHGPLLLLIGLFSISPATIVPGMTWLSASLALLPSLQMALGARHAWLPKRVLNARVSQSSVRGMALRAAKWARPFDALLKPRLTFLAEPPFVNLLGVLCALAALATFPLGLIPAAPVAPGLAIALFGAGIMMKDGLLLLLGSAVVSSVVWLTYLVVT
jgi:hypothetical protein